MFVNEVEKFFAYVGVGSVVEGWVEPYDVAFSSGLVFCCVVFEL